MISEKDRIEVLDSNKIQREKRRISKGVLEERVPDVTGFKCIGMDSKRDSNALVLKEIETGDGENLYVKSTEEVDHLTFTIESG